MRYFTWKLRAVLSILAIGLQAAAMADDGILDDAKQRDTSRRQLFAPLGGLLERFSEGPAGSSRGIAREDEALPGRLACVRVSRKLLEQYMTREVDCEQPVNDTILNTELTGRGRTRGQTRLVLHANADSVLAEVVFEGTIETQTNGVRGPVKLKINATTQFTARKQLLITGDGITVSPSTATAETTSETSDIETKSGGMRGRILEGVARRRSEELRDEANTIAAQHAAEQVRQGLDTEVDAVVAKSQAVLARLFNGRGESAHKLAWRSTADYIEVVLARPGDANVQGDSAPPAIEGNPGIAARVHHTVVRRALADPSLVKSLGPFLVSLRIDDQDADPAAKQDHITWSAGRTWLVVDHAGPKIRLASSTQQAPPTNSSLLNLDSVPRIAESKP